MNYLSPQEILYIHSRVVENLGGKHGSSDIVLLKKLTNYTHNTEIFPDKFSKAAALLFGIAKKKPFLDANLKTAVTVMQAFLEINKSTLDITEDSFQKFINQEFSKAKVEDIRKFLVQSSKPLS